MTIILVNILLVLAIIRLGFKVFAIAGQTVLEARRAVKKKKKKIITTNRPQSIQIGFCARAKNETV